LIKSDSKDFYIVTKKLLFQINAVLLNFTFLRKKITVYHKNIKHFNIDNNKKCFWADIDQHIRMISEGSCDTEDWSNDAENSALPSQE